MKSYVSGKIKELRKNSGMTQSELAKKLGISPSAVGMYEQGRREPDSEMLLRLCEVFSVSTDTLLGNSTGVDEKSRELTDVFDEFTQLLSTQQGLMFDGVPLNDEDRSKIVDAVKVVAAIAKQQQMKKTFG